jgi:hypothetical protein
MPDFKSMKVLIWDGSGDNVEHAVRLAKDVKEVHYYTVDVEETASKVNGRDVDKSPIYELYKIMEEIEDFRSMGIDF